MWAGWIFLAGLVVGIIVGFFLLLLLEMSMP